MTGENDNYFIWYGLLPGDLLCRLPGEGVEGRRLSYTHLKVCIFYNND